IIMNTNASVSGNSSFSYIPTVSDPNQDQLTYLWQQLSGVQVLNQNLTSQELTFTSPVKSNQDQILQFRFSVSDSWISTSKDFEVKVLANQAPRVFVDSQIQSSLPNLPFTFHSSASDPDNDSLSYIWRIISSAGFEIQIINGLDQEQLSITTPNVTETTQIIVGVKSSDGALESGVICVAFVNKINYCFIQNFA
ncbi:hypothetical protein MJH12_19860, partial [bacterium]|nr:hypothetical protein [bacterium]